MDDYVIYTVAIDSSINDGLEYYYWYSSGLSSHSQFTRVNELTTYMDLDVLLAIF